MTTEPVGMSSRLFDENRALFGQIPYNMGIVDDFMQDIDRGPNLSRASRTMVIARLTPAQNPLGLARMTSMLQSLFLLTSCAVCRPMPTAHAA